MTRRDLTEAEEWVAHIERMIDVHREAKRRQLLKRAVKLWRETAMQEQMLRFEIEPELVH